MAMWVSELAVEQFTAVYGRATVCKGKADKGRGGLRNRQARETESRLLCYHPLNPGSPRGIYLREGGKQSTLQSIGQVISGTKSLPMPGCGR